MVRMIGLILAIVLMSINAFPATSSRAQDEGSSHMALIINGTCEEALSQESMTTTTWPLNNIEGEDVGSNPYPDPSTIGTTTNIDASLNELTSEPRGVAVFAPSDDPYELTIYACGDLVGDPAAQPG